MSVFARRPFLWILASGVLAACTPPRNEAPASAQSAAPAASDDAGRFLALSAILTGYSDLDASLAERYVSDLRANAARGATLDEIFKNDDWRKGAVFTDPAQLSLASQILQTWYSGISNGASGPATVTWTQALAWRACRFAKAPSTCAVPGSWAKAPQA